MCADRSCTILSVRLWQQQQRNIDKRVLNSELRIVEVNLTLLVEIRTFRVHDRLHHQKPSLKPQLQVGRLEEPGHPCVCNSIWQPPMMGESCAWCRLSATRWGFLCQDNRILQRLPVHMLFSVLLHRYRLTMLTTTTDMSISSFRLARPGIKITISAISGVTYLSNTGPVLNKPVKQ